MSKTLFWYVFRDLMKVFILTSLCLAGIMSFGGLLKPFMQYGLSGMQVARMVSYFLPAMLTYSLPISVLFATTVVYGRLSADNELVACRAGGISAASMAMPAVVLGLALSSISLLSLSFVVPYYTLRVEKVVFDSLADAVQKSIQRTHQIKFDDKITIFAERAEIKPPPADSPDDEVVVLYGPMVSTFEKNDQRVDVPSEFYSARTATAVIHRTPDDEIQFSAFLDDCVRFPREFGEQAISGLGTFEIGPISHASPIRENTKFMDIRQLKKLYYDPTKSRQIREFHRKITQEEQEKELARRVAEGLRSRGQFLFAGETESYLLSLEPGARTEAPTPSKLLLTSGDGGAQVRRLRLQRLVNGQPSGVDEARDLRLRLDADPSRDRVRVEFELLDAVVGAGGPTRSAFSRRLSMPMPPAIAALKQRSPVYYLLNGDPDRSKEISSLRRKLPGLQSGILGEINARIAFAVSCAILVTIGAALGMMFRTGNYLNAFALSVIPALLCIALAVTGQHICESGGDSWPMGVTVIWSGNIIVAILAVALLGHLQRH
jgi:lipopolysaccharide export LptBFGC system permease protein LptF